MCQDNNEVFMERKLHKTEQSSYCPSITPRKQKTNEKLKANIY